MNGKRIARTALLVACGCLLAIAGAVSSAATVKVGSLVVHAEATFSPRALPQRSYAPVEIEGKADVHLTTGGQPSPVKEVVLDFDRDSLLLTRGLSVCRPAKIEQTTVSQARRRCAGAIVGTGHVQAIVPVGLFRVKVRVPLTLFNGPSPGAAATVLVHAQPIPLLGETYVVPVPIERERGAYRYRARIDVPKIFGGAGSLTELDAKIGRRYRFRGVGHSFASARCSDGALAAHARLIFAGGTVIEGLSEEACTALP
ncbi:MAG TPA: hypothetical protein VII45_05435 [Solirubrobacterales bacterium]